MKQSQITKSKYIQQLTTAAKLLTDQRTSEAVEIIDSIFGESLDTIDALCAKSLRERSKQEMPMYLRSLDDPDKQINIFDLVLRAVPPVQAVSSMALQRMLSLYGQGVESFTHLNIGIGKGRFELKLLEELSRLPAEKIPKFIRIIGVDIDNASLCETGESIKIIEDSMFPATTKIEYIPIFAFAEAISPSVWEDVKAHNTQVLGVISAFTLHHIPTSRQRQEVIDKVSECSPNSFTLLEPDVNHFTPNLLERLVNCWSLFGAIFKLIDTSGVSPEVGTAIKNTFFGREIEDILGNDEEKRSEKHEESHIWAKRLTRAGFNLIDLPEDIVVSQQDNHASMDIIVDNYLGCTKTSFEGVPLVAMFTTGK